MSFLSSFLSKLFLSVFVAVAPVTAPVATATPLVVQQTASTTTKAPIAVKTVIATSTPAPVAKSIEQKKQPEKVVEKTFFKDSALVSLNAMYAQLSLLQTHDTADTVFAAGLLLQYQSTLQSLGKAQLSKEARASFFKNYSLFLKIQKQYSANTNDELAISFREVKKGFETQFINESKKAAATVVTPSGTAPKKVSTSLFGNSLLADIASAFSGQVIHKRTVVNVADPGTNWPDPEEMRCWRYESWVYTDGQRARYEQSLGTGNNSDPTNCAKEVDIINNQTGEKLALDPIRKHAEWINKTPGKFGVGQVGEADPNAEYAKLLDDPHTVIEEPQTVDGRDLYVVRNYIYDEGEVGREYFYTQYYVDSVTFFPYQEDTYFGQLIDDGSGEFKYSGSVKNNSFIFDVTEIIDRSSLPLDFFELVVPEGYEMVDFVAFG